MSGCFINSLLNFLPDRLVSGTPFQMESENVSSNTWDYMAEKEQRFEKK
jgi:hypothetical protein